MSEVSGIPLLPVKSASRLVIPRETRLSSGPPVGSSRSNDVADCGTGQKDRHFLGGEIGADGAFRWSRVNIGQSWLGDRDHIANRSREAKNNPAPHLDCPSIVVDHRRLMPTAEATAPLLRECGSQ